MAKIVDGQTHQHAWLKDEKEVHARANQLGLMSVEDAQPGILSASAAVTYRYLEILARTPVSLPEPYLTPPEQGGRS